MKIFDKKYKNVRFLKQISLETSSNLGEMMGICAKWTNFSHVDFCIFRIISWMHNSAGASLQL